MAERSPLFDECLAFLLKLEGGFSNVPGDRGGPTNHGVTQKTYDHYRQTCQLEPQPVNQISAGEVCDLYYTLYWCQPHIDCMPGPLALCVFDAAVHQGPKKAVTMLQECVGTFPDGIFGPKTMKAVLQERLRPLVHRYLSLRYHILLEIAKQPGQAQFEQGWINRLLRLKKKVNAMLIASGQ